MITYLFLIGIVLSNLAVTFHPVLFVSFSEFMGLLLDWNGSLWKEIETKDDWLNKATHTHQIKVKLLHTKLEARYDIQLQ